MDKVLSVKIPKLVKEGVFGDVTFESIKAEYEINIGAQFGSCLFMGNLEVKNKSSVQNDKIPVVIKIPSEVRIDSYDIFRREFMMYDELLPALGLEQELYPKLYYGKVAEEESLLIFDNICSRGFRNSDIEVFLDFEHVSLAVKSLAKLHSLSYILKHKRRETFETLGKKLNGINHPAANLSAYDLPNHAAIERGVRVFEKENGNDQIFERFLKSTEKPSQIKQLLSEPDETFEVISHGDFCNNNVMYRYNNENVPTDLIFFDFQYSIYGSVAPELAFFLCLNTDNETKEKHWDDFLNIYWTTLRGNVPEDINLPSYQDFLKHFSSRAVYGYIICSFFLPLMLDKSVVSWNDYTTEEQVELCRTYGGQKADKCLGEVVSYFYKKKYIHEFVDFYESNSLKMI